MGTIYLHFFSVGSGIALAMTFLGSLFLLSIRPKSSATFHLGMMLLLISGLALGYMVAGALYSEHAAFHRWLTVAVVLPAVAHAAQIFLNFPDTKHPRFAKVLLASQWLVGLIFTVYFYAASWAAPKVYHFDGHYWDFGGDRAERAAAVVSYVILAYILIFLGTAVHRIVTDKSGHRWVVFGLLLSLLIITVVPAVLNTLSREGAMDRGTFSTVYDLCNVLGTFFLIVIYVNNTGDRTTFMAKIVGISLVLVLLILQAMSYFFISERDDSYDGVHRELTSRILLDGSQPDDLVYTLEFSAAPRSFNVRHDGGWKGEDFVPLESEFRNALLCERIANLPDPVFEKELPAILDEAHPTFSGYGLLIRKINAAIPAGRQERARLILRGIDDLKYSLLYRGNKIRKIPGPFFRAKLNEFLRAQKGDFLPFRTAIEKHIEVSKSEGEVLKAEVLEFLAPSERAAARRYREKPGGRIVSFMKFDASSGKMYEAGYSYDKYREFLHPAGSKLALMIGSVLLIVLVGFRFFFLGALIRPLNALLDGVKRVDENDLNVHVPVRVEDEIGLITSSFNKMVSSIQTARDKLRDYAEHLEEKVKERTEELQETLTQVQSLKTQQDGDYFLTSLLIRPLAMNRCLEGPVQVKFLIKQKKQFAFRKWRDEIGGDICMADKIVLKGKAHTVFANADAMGKSMQGAGGALVFAAVFSAVIARTHISSEMQNQYPERWIKNAFLELQAVFESFDGSMLVSLVIGLVDDDSGLMYYLNAEHPFTVILRNGKAGFLESELCFRKLGTQGMRGTLHVDTFQLAPGDVIVAGSDGRDDLLLGASDSGQRIINNDENLFPRVVEEAQGDLESIHRLLASYGELTDDLSLARLGYREDRLAEPSDDHVDSVRQRLAEARGLAKQEMWTDAIIVLENARALDNHKPEIFRALATAYFKDKQYEKAASAADDYICLQPGNLDYVYLASRSYKLAGKLREAIDLGERVRLRKPGLIRNLLSLSSCYARMGNLTRAEMLVKEALSYEPDDPRAHKLRLAIENAQSAARVRNGPSRHGPHLENG